MTLAELSRFLTLTRKDLAAFVILLLFLIYFVWYSYCNIQLSISIESIQSNEWREGMRGYLYLSLFLGMFLFLTVRYSFIVAFGVMYFGVMLVIIGATFALRYSQMKRSRSSVLGDQPVYPESSELMTSKNLHAT